MITTRLLPILVLPLLSSGSALAQFAPPVSDAPLDMDTGGTRFSDEIMFDAPERSLEIAPSNTRGLSSQTRGGGCQAGNAESDLPVLALTSPSGGYTVTGRPSFAVFMPPTNANYASLEIYSEDLNEIVLQLEIKLPDEVASTAGIVHIKSPAELTERLGIKAGEGYWWAFTPYCSSSFQTLTVTPAWSQGDLSDPSPSAWIARVDEDSEVANPPSELAPLDLAIWYAERGVWFDTLDVLIAEMDNPVADVDRAQRLWSQLIEPQLTSLQTEYAIETSSDIRDIADQPILEIAPDDITVVYPVIPMNP